MKRKSDNFAEIEKLQRMMGRHDDPD